MPSNWRTASMSDVAEIILGQSPPSTTYNENGIGLPFFQGKSEFGKEYPTAVKWCSKPQKIAQPGDILISVRAPVGPTNLCKETSCIGRGLAAIRTKEHSNNKYILYYLKFIEKEWDSKATGTTFKAITGKVLSEQKILVPPIEEQEQIVLKIEELFSQLDAGVAGLKRVQVLLKQYRASVLKAAFEGRLVPQDPNDEPVSDMLRKFGISPSVTNNLNKIPENWFWIKLEDAVSILDNKRIPINSKGREKRIANKEITELYPYYGATGQVGWIDDFLFDEELVLLGEDGAPFLDYTKEKAYIVTGNFWVNNHAHVLRAIKSLTTNRYLFYYLNYFDYRDYVTGTTRLKLNQGRMKQIPFALAPYKEQERITKELDKSFSLIQYLEGLINSLMHKSSKCNQAILKRAFNGNL